MRGAGSRWSAWWMVLAMLGCTPWERPAAPPNRGSSEQCTAATQAPALLPVVTVLQTRDHEVTVHAADDGLRFTVALAGGELLGRQLTEAELERSFPGLHQRFTSAFADDRIRLDTWLDASVHGSRTTPADTAAVGVGRSGPE